MIVNTMHEAATKEEAYVYLQRKYIEVSEHMRQLGLSINKTFDEGFSCSAPKDGKVLAQYIAGNPLQWEFDLMLELQSGPFK